MVHLANAFGCRTEKHKRKQLTKAPYQLFDCLATFTHQCGKKSFGNFLAKWKIYLCLLMLISDLA